MGKLSKNTIQQLFNKYDKNKNGVIEKGELTECFKEIIGSIEEMSPEELEKIVNEGMKNFDVVSGGEKVRCVLSKLMLSGANFLAFDEPTNHLDMEAITALNEGMKNFDENANGVIELNEFSNIIKFFVEEKGITFEE